MRSAVESYPVDIEPAQVVRWVKAEHDVWPSAFRITAVRTREVREIPARSEFHLGDEEREDLSEVATVASVEIAPGNAAHGWRLRILVEDEIGPRLSRAESARLESSRAGSAAAVDAMPDDDDELTASEATEQQLDLGAFYREFIRPGRGTATITADADGAEGRRRLAALLKTIEKDGPHHGTPAATATASRGRTASRRRRAGAAVPPLVLRRGH